VLSFSWQEQRALLPTTAKRPEGHRHPVYVLAYEANYPCPDRPEDGYRNLAYAVVARTVQDFYKRRLTAQGATRQPPATATA
jgi:hypothetical protein